MLTPAQVESLIVGTNPAAIAHRDALPGILPAVAAAAAVHFEVTHSLCGPGMIKNDCDHALMLLSAHALNLHLELVHGIMAGRFDTAIYLERPAYDVGSLVFYVGTDEAAANSFLKGDEVRASAARKAFVEIASRFAVHVWPTVAADLDRIYRDEADALNDVAHIGALHLDKLLEREGDGSLSPTIAGRVDVDEARRMLCAAALAEAHALNGIRIALQLRLPEWDTRANDAVDGLSEWVTENGDPAPPSSSS